MLENVYSYVVLFIVIYIIYSIYVKKYITKYNKQEEKTLNNIEKFDGVNNNNVINTVVNTGDNIGDNTGIINTNNNRVQSDILESGHCHQPQTNVEGSTFALDTSYIQQLSKVENAKDFIGVIKTLRQQYQDKLQKTVNNIYSEQNNIADELSEVQNNFNKYGLETLSKQYYDTIYRYGTFESVKDSIIPNETNNTQNNNNIISNSPEENVIQNNLI
jgi:hypothetical protein